MPEPFPVVVQYSRFTAGSRAGGTPSVFYDVLEPASGPRRPPIVMLHGGTQTSACYLVTADGRPGWAHGFAARGHRVFVPDWPGSGRSGGVPFSKLDGALVCAALAKVLADVGEPAILLTHSMGGAFGWKLLETNGADILKLVAVAPAPPGNIQPAAAVLARGEDYIDVRQPAGTMRLHLRSPVFLEDGYANVKLIGNGTQFPDGQRAGFLAALQPVAPLLVIERTNVDGRQLRVTDFTSFTAKPILLLVSTDDIDHTEATDRPIVDWLNANGAAATFIALGARCITGNGHMMMLERNSDAIAAVIADWIDT